MANKRHSKAFKQMVLERMRWCDNISALSEELGVHRRLLYTWRDKLDLVDSEKGLPPENSRETTLRKEVSKLKRVLADKTMETDFFRGALQKVEARRQRKEGSGEKASTTKSGK